jgi:hypothetical protein
MWQAIMRNLPEKTGKTYEEWKEVILKQGPGSTRDRIKWLKEVHGLGHYQAKFVVREMEKPADYRPPTDTELLEGQYKGKAAIRPIYEALAKIIEKLPEAKLEFRKTYVTLTRNRQFGIIQPSTKTRIDLGLILPGVPLKERLEDPKGFGSDRITHKIILHTVDEVDSQIREWIRSAYEADA